MSDGLDRLLGSWPVARVAIASSRRHLRVLAYHGVPDAAAFGAHLDVLVDKFNVVSGTEVADALDGRCSLPDRALWITFDDGDPDLISNGLPELVARGLVATAFLCPGVIDTTEPYWWQDLAAPIPAEVFVQFPDLPNSSAELVALLKRAPDIDRVAVVSEVRRVRAERGETVVRRQLSSEEVLRWVSSGQEVGNHTFDHPLLDQCSLEDATRQIVEAHSRLQEMLGVAPQFFAWPNGNRCDALLPVLESCRYRVVVNFDHRLCSRAENPHDVSRLRIDSNASLPRLMAVASGSHSAFFQARARVGKLTASAQ